MNLYYSTNKLERLLSENRLIKKYYPREYSKNISRLSELIVADNLVRVPNIPPPRRYKLYGDRAGCWGIDYAKDYRIIRKAIHKFDIEDLTAMTDIMITALEDYHS